ncbi:toll/interleukin-1 receptor domain-containing protein [uncultured Dokdonia sp.]|uniref:toll/interleukin-1 receptor domain-containing protein n=1 Tax=uncultured Dokdonia sp. TaxID=575653 RepID=UPI00260CDB1B|nr:toll/interleukin-1 receptor domain-containing protein [uncultured Dokdonia sp.]
MQEEEKFDFFISHASEDKKTFVKPLVKMLTNNGFNVWYDELTLKIGDSLFSSISNGIKNSRYAILILSKSFFSKQWTKKELETLISKEVYNEKNIILPIWLGIDFKDVYNFSPMLVDKLAVQVTNNEIEKAYNAILNKFEDNVITQNSVEKIVNDIINFSKDDRKKYILDLETRIKNLFYYSKEFYEWYTSDDAFGDKDWDDEIHEKKDFELLTKYNLPVGLSHNNEYHADFDMKTIIRLCKKWINQKISLSEAAFLEYMLDDGIDTDPHFILYGELTKHLKDHHAYYSSLAGIYNAGIKKRISEVELENARSKAFAKFYNIDNIKIE